MLLGRRRLLLRRAATEVNCSIFRKQTLERPSSNGFRGSFLVIRYLPLSVESGGPTNARPQTPQPAVDGLVDGIQVGVGGCSPLRQPSRWPDTAAQMMEE